MEARDQLLGRDRATDDVAALQDDDASGRLAPGSPPRRGRCGPPPMMTTSCCSRSGTGPPSLWCQGRWSQGGAPGAGPPGRRVPARPCRSAGVRRSARSGRQLEADEAAIRVPRVSAIRPLERPLPRQRARVGAEVAPEGAVLDPGQEWVLGHEAGIARGILVIVRGATGTARRCRGRRPARTPRRDPRPAAGDRCHGRGRAAGRRPRSRATGGPTPTGRSPEIWPMTSESISPSAVQVRQSRCRLPIGGPM